jgi:hypothetical protein
VHDFQKDIFCNDARDELQKKDQKEAENVKRHVCERSVSSQYDFSKIILELRPPEMLDFGTAFIC